MTSPSPKHSAGYIPWWLLAIVTGVFAVAALALWGLALATRPANLDLPTVTAIVVIASTSAPASTDAPPTVLAPTQPAIEPSATVPPPPPGEVRVGVYVQVIGTGDSGFLNLRAEPSLSAAVNYLALEREVLQVQAGPNAGDDLTWWYLVEPATNTKFGWGVQNYLQVVEGP